MKINKQSQSNKDTMDSQIKYKLTLKLLRYMNNILCRTASIYNLRLFVLACYQL